MSKLNLFSQAQEQLRNLPAHISLVVFHPDFHSQNRLLGQIVADPTHKLVFVTVPHPRCTLKEFVALLEDAFATQLNISLTLPASSHEAAAAVAGALRNAGKTVLIVGAYDFVEAAEVDPLILALVPQLPEGVRLILSTRQLPVGLLTAPALRPHTALVPVNPDKMVLDYAQPTDKKILEVRALGPGRVLIDGRLIDHWDGVLPRTLFFYFVDRAMTTRDEIFQTFWPALSTREATNVFHVTKRKISEILGTDLTVYWSGFYRISPELELHYDVVKFAEAVQNAAVTEDDEALQLLHNAIDLYRGPFLSTIEQPWIEQRRAELASNYAEALAVLARLYANRHSPQEALGYFLRAAAANPQREDLVRHIMELYQQMGKPAEALEAYERLKWELQQTLGVSPGPQTEKLAETIRASM
jgi:DNA-binding SARP family transcriptional activator